MSTKRVSRSVNRVHKGFTLIELLTVIAIITLLIGLLVPALSRAREQAKAAATRAVLKAASDGLNMFRNENPRECRGGDGYPSSSMRDDPTEEGEQRIFGAQWLVRFLMGKNLDGYIPRRNVPRQMLLEPEEHWEQKHWYSLDTSENEYAPLERIGPYLSPDGVTVALPKDLEGAEGDHGPAIDERTMEQPVILDSFGYPVLYYAANTRLLKAKQSAAPIACFDDTPNPDDPPLLGIYTHADNGLFTGLCEGTGGGGGTYVYQPWDFAGIGPDGHELAGFGEYTNDTPTDPDDFTKPENIHTFPYYVLNKDVFHSTFDDSTTQTRATLVPYRRDTFLLITPGPDGVYGTQDDVTNF